MRTLLSAILLLALIAAPQAALSFGEKDHQRWLRECPEYREADRALGEAWNRLKSLSDSEHYRLEIEEQRGWQRNSDSLARRERREGEDLAQAAARVLTARLAILNWKILRLDPDYITFSIERDVPMPRHDGPETVADLAIVPSRPVLMNWHYTIITGKTERNRRLVEYLLNRAEDFYSRALRENNGFVVHDTLLADFHDTADAELMLRRAAEGGDIHRFTDIDRYDIVHENSSIACVHPYYFSSVGLARGYHYYGNTLFYDLDSGIFIAFDDLFKRPEAARTLIRGAVYRKMQDAIEMRRAAEPDWRPDSDVVDRLTGLIDNLDLRDAYLAEDAVCFEFTWRELDLINGGGDAPAGRYFPNPLIIPASEFRIAGPLNRYFKR
ncbi:MAG: hypothetical protein Q4F72_11810 [Desulfovibrionaceae bacterium]|nr:hypothetical protein [Desulfovibrionaceae bacterium]